MNVISDKKKIYNILMNNKFQNKMKNYDFKGFSMKYGKPYKTVLSLTITFGCSIETGAVEVY